MLVVAAAVGVATVFAAPFSGETVPLPRALGPPHTPPADHPLTPVPLRALEEVWADTGLGSHCSPWRAQPPQWGWGWRGLSRCLRVTSDRLGLEIRLPCVTWASGFSSRSLGDARALPQGRCRDGEALRGLLPGLSHFGCCGESRMGGVRALGWTEAGLCP